MANSGKFLLEVFDGDGDYTIWRMKMKSVLVQLEVFDAVTGDYQGDATAKEITKMNNTAISMIITHLDGKVIHEIGACDTAQELWTRLDRQYQVSTLPNKMALLTKFYSFRFEEEKSVKENMDVFYRMIQELTLCGEAITEQQKCIILLNALPDAYNIIREFFECSNQVQTTFKQVLEAVKAKESRLGIKKPGQEAMLAKWRPPSEGGTKKYQNPRWKKYKERKPEHSGARKCYYCGREGHFIKDCRKKSFDSKGKQPVGNNSKHNNNSTSNSVFNMHNEYMVLCACTSNDVDCWIIDSGSTLNVCSVKNWFVDLKLIDGGPISMCDGHSQKIAGIGTVPIRMHDNEIRLLTDVRYVPTFKRNLISESVLTDKGFSIMTEGDSKRIFKGKIEVMRAIKKCGLYVLEGKVETKLDNRVNSVTESKAHLWHKRLGHISNTYLDKLASSSLIDGVENEKVEFCEVCLEGKHHRAPFKRSSKRAESEFEYAHADLWGPAPVATLGGKKYFLSIVDDFSRKTWVFLLRNKSDAFDKFIEWHTLYENQQGKKLKALRTDNGMEFCNLEFNDFCSKLGILRHRTVRLTPQQNGVAERMNRTLLNKVRCLLASSGLGTAFWGEALSTATFLINRSPCVAIDHKTPEEIWTKRKPNLSFLKPFGCLTMAHQNLGKLKPRSKRCVLLGYPEGVKGYRLLSLEDRGTNIMISRDCVFNENEFPFLNLNDAPVKPVIERFKVIDVHFPVQIEYDDDESDPETVNVDTSVSVPEHEPLEPGTDSVPEPQPSDQILEDYQLTRDRSRRRIIPNRRYQTANLVELAFHVAKDVSDSVPETYKDAIECENSREWIAAMNEEINSLHKNRTWIVVKKPVDRNIIECKWIFKIKDPEGSDEKPRFKARLVAKGFRQKHGIDYGEIFAPVVKYKTIRILLALAVQFDFEIEQLDVKTAFLYGTLEETIYMTQPEGYEDRNIPGGVCLLKKIIVWIETVS